MAKHDFKILIIIATLILSIIASGCVGGQDVTSAFKALPEVQQFMKEHPDAKITVTYWSKDDVAQSSQEISQQCDKPITPINMYKATVSEGNLKVVSWINAENQIVICSTTTGSGEASSETTPKSGTQSNDLKIINLHAEQIILTDTEIKELVGTDLTKKGQRIIPETIQNHVLSGIYAEYGNPNISIWLYVSPTIDAANGVSQSLASESQKNFKVIVNRVDIGDTEGELYSIVGSQNEKTTVVAGGSYIIFRKNNIIVLVVSTPDVKIETLLLLAKKQEEKISNILDVISTTGGSSSPQITNPTPNPIQTQTSTSIAAPTVSISIANNPDTTSPDMKIQHKGGDTLKAGDWKLSIVPVGNSPWFNNQGSDFAVGNQIIITTTSEGLPLSSGGKYDVKLVHIPSNTMLLDTVVEVR
ncbi:MAG: hypothetical protein O8C66_03975 [Candidatus Methanoperedens sp.]|nr:hypothetical protein [Candidatus Methanoperedens sp.]MCZ7369645.1 hypothetical protein [Candidatus Methanoperedens sp.]